MTTPRKSSPMRNRIRIIGGEWRSRLIAFPESDELRPTPDRVRETLFNWLGQTMHGRTCLDLFAGSGALGFEALSRGATRVVMVEKEKQALAALRRNAELLNATGAQIVNRDARQFLAEDHERFDVIFVDPPYGARLLPDLLPLLSDRLKAHGTLYFEDDRMAEVPPGWKIIRQSRAGAVRFQLARPIGEGEDDQGSLSGNV
jgi:16S rRNA (guanine(966)-N(2))-methyltransferase RsmD